MDSVEVRADVELGGTDQLFNLHHGPPSAAARRPGSRRSCSPRRCSSGSTASRRCRSRSATTSGSTKPPGEQFGKIMSIPDALLPMYFAHATAWPPEQIDADHERARGGHAAPERGQAARRADGRRPLPRRRRGRRGRGRIRPRAQGPRRADRHAPSSRSPSGTDVGRRPGHDRSGRLQARGAPGARARARCAATARSSTATASVPDGTHVLQNGKRKWARVHVG